MIWLFAKRRTSLGKADVGDFAGDFVDHQKQNQVNHGIEQADSGGIAVSGALNALFVDVDGDDIAGGLVQIGLQEPNLFKADVHQIACAHHQHQHSGGEKLGQVDLQNPLEHGRAVDLGRFIKSDVHVGQGGQIDDGAPSGVLPDAGRDIDGAESAALRQEVHAGAQKQIDESAGGTEEDAEHTADNHNRDEMRGVEHGLYHAAEPLEPELIDGQREDDGNREAPEQV